VGRVCPSLGLVVDCESTDRPAPVLPALRAAVPETRGDLATFRAMLAGTMPVARGMALIAAAGGWPIRSERGFIVATPGPGPVSLAGDHNDWRPTPMQHQNGLCWSHVAAPAGAEPSRYKLVVGDRYQADCHARCYGYDERGEYSLLGSRGAHLERWQLGGPGIAARTVRVWVPAEPATHHLYVHDGQNLFSPDAPHGGWKLHESAGPRTLVIGIDHEKRFSELTPWSDTIVDGRERGGNGAAYADFTEQVVRRHIEARYGNPDRVGVMGSSLGGLMALYQAQRFPNGYDFAASLSGTVGWGNLDESGGETIIDAYDSAPTTPIHLYLDWGGSPGGRDNYDDNVRLVGVLSERGYNLTHFHEPGGLHQEDAWAARLWRPLEIFEAL